MSVQDIRMINADLTAEAVVNILAIDDPKVNPEGIINLELEVCMHLFFSYSIYSVLYSSWNQQYTKAQVLGSLSWLWLHSV